MKTPTKQESVSKKNPHTIFWADDDLDDLSMFKEVAVKVEPNHKIIEFFNGKELLDHLENLATKELPCLIVLDMNMPVLSGKQTLQQLKNNSRFCNIPVVLFTTSNSKLDADFCTFLGASMITKPNSFAQLEAVLRTMLALCDA